jgi:transposase
VVENCIPFELPGFRIKSVENRADHLTIVAQATATEGACPHCGERSSQIHSHYTRSPQDVPSSGKTVRLVLKVRRFRCLNDACSAVTFAERLPSVVGPCAQRTVRLTNSLNRLDLALGGKPGARLSKRLGMAASPSTVLRLVRRTVLPCTGRKGHHTQRRGPPQFLATPFSRGGMPHAVGQVL